MEERFEGKVILITGAGRGVGRAAAEGFARLGASLALNDITPVNLDVTVARVQAIGAPVREYVYDMSKQMPVESMIDRALTDWGRIDALVYCAGVHPRAPLFALDEWDWRHTLDVNLSGPFFSLQIAGRAMQRQGGGAVVFFIPGEPGISTNANHEAAAAPGIAFTASKMGLVGLTCQAARELAADGIRVNALRLDALPPEGGNPAISAQRSRRIAQIVQEIIFLCSQSGAGVSGEVITVKDPAPDR